ncbi:MAG: hypothetical protein PHW73_00625 [Atribacterota bacterium]|nr:hypothetical protein [Atribacterota bacterium]
METKTVNFRIGADMGILLMQIAQEHLIYNYNPKKAVETITESLHGCPVELALKIIKGDVILVVDEEEQNIITVDRDDSIHTIFPKLDLTNWISKESSDIYTAGRELIKTMNDALYTMKYNHVYVTFEYSSVIDYVCGNDRGLLDELDRIEEISRVALLIKVTKQLIEKSMKIQSVIDFIKFAYPETFTEDCQRKYDNLVDTLMRTTEKLSEITHLDFKQIEMEQAGVDSYIKAAIEIDNTLSHEIQPVNIMDNWSAGWLSPDAEYYALNGEIVNYLHNQIANALQKKGVIPSDAENPDVWLEQHGWVKIHKENINFAGCLNYQLQKTNIDMTPVQIKAIYEYGALCCGGKLRMGWRGEIISAAMFQMLAENLESLYKKYFEF